MKEKVERELENYRVEDELEKHREIIIRGVEKKFMDGPETQF